MVFSTALPSRHVFYFLLVYTIKSIPTRELCPAFTSETEHERCLSKVKILPFLGPNNERTSQQCTITSTASIKSLNSLTDCQYLPPRAINKEISGHEKSLFFLLCGKVSLLFIRQEIRNCKHGVWAGSCLALGDTHQCLCSC